MAASEPIEFKPSVGLHADIPMDVYRASEGVAASDLKNMQRSPAYARMRNHVSTPAQEWGTAVHTAILEPEALDERHPIEPQQPADNTATTWRATKLYKEQRAEQVSRPEVESVLSLQQREDLGWIQKRVAENPIGAQLHDLMGIREASVFGWDDDHELWRKCRPDWIVYDARMFVDVKTAQDHRAPGFARACHRYGYHMSAAYYLDTAELAGLDIDHYVFLVVSADAPFEVATYTLDEDSIDQGRFEYRRALAQWRDCREEQRWPGGSSQIEELRLPEFAINYHEQENI